MLTDSKNIIMTTIKKIINNTWLHLAVFSVVIVACETTEETFEEFRRDGETIYIGAPDSVIVAPGFEKLRFWVAINADPKISKGLLETNAGDFRHEFEVVRTRNGRDTITFDLDLDEGEYTFGLFLMDDLSNRSVRREVPATVFGQNYRASLLNRGISGIDTLAGEAIIHWADAVPGILLTELTYEDGAGAMQTAMVANEDPETAISSYKPGGKIRVSSTYKPAENAIEVFSAIPSEFSFPD